MDGENVSNVLSIFVSPSLSQAPSAKVRAKHNKVAIKGSIYSTNIHIRLYLYHRAEGACSIGSSNPSHMCEGFGSRLLVPNLEMELKPSTISLILF